MRDPCEWMLALELRFVKWWNERVCHRAYGCDECGYDNGFKYREETSDGVSPGTMRWYYCLGCNGGGRRRQWRNEADRRVAEARERRSNPLVRE